MKILAAPLFMYCILEDIEYYLILDLPPLPWPRPSTQMLLRKGEKQLEGTVKEQKGRKTGVDA